jgi:hypothetical protein
MRRFSGSRRRRAAVALSAAVIAGGVLAAAAAPAGADTCHVWGGGYIPFLSNYTTCDTIRGAQATGQAAGGAATAVAGRAQALADPNSCFVWGGGFIPGLSNYTTCDTKRGAQDVWEGPDRSPDYVVFDTTAQAGQFGFGSSLIRTRDGSLYTAVSGSASPARLSVPVPKNLTLPIAAIGYVGSPRDYNPSDAEIDGFVSGLSANVTFGLGSGIRLVSSLMSHEVGVEYVAGGVLGVSYGLGTATPLLQAPAQPSSPAPATPSAPPPLVLAPPSAPTYHVTARPALLERGGPSTSYAIVGSLAGGSAVSISCQTSGVTRVGTSYIWDRLADGAWISDWWVDTPAVGAFSPGLPLCPPTPSSANIAHPRTAQ